MFLVWSLIDRSIELALNLVPFKGLLSLFIYFVALRKCFYLNRCNDRLGLNMPDACSSSLPCRMVCVTRSTTPSHHALSIIYIHYIYFEIESCIAIFSLFSPTKSILATAWILARITRSSSAHVSSRQLFTLDNTSFSENCWQHGPPFTSREQPHPSRKNLFTFAIISSFSRTSSSNSSMITVWVALIVALPVTWCFSFVLCKFRKECGYSCVTNANLCVSLKRSLKGWWKNYLFRRWK